MSRPLFLSQLYADTRRTDIDFFAHPSIWYSNKVGASRPSKNAPLPRGFTRCGRKINRELYSSGFLVSCDVTPTNRHADSFINAPNYATYTPPILLIHQSGFELLPTPDHSILAPPLRPVFISHTHLDSLASTTFVHPVQNAPAFPPLNSVKTSSSAALLRPTWVSAFAEPGIASGALTAKERVHFFPGEKYDQNPIDQYPGPIAKPAEIADIEMLDVSQASPFEEAMDVDDPVESLPVDESVDIDMCEPVPAIIPRWDAPVKQIFVPWQASALPVSSFIKWLPHLPPKRHTILLPP